jgi:hypothetical protein
MELEMGRPSPPWTAEEFDTLLRNASLSDAVLAERLPGRTAGAVGVVREAVHRYHSAGTDDMLSEVMRRRLRSRSRTTMCSKCLAQL